MWRSYICGVCEEEITDRQNWHEGFDGQMHWKCEVELGRVKQQNTLSNDQSRRLAAENVKSHRRPFI